MAAVQLFEAAEYGDVIALQRFDQTQLNEGVSDEFGCTCLHYGARQGGVDILQFLVQQRGFTGKIRSNIGATAAHDAAAAGNLETLQWLLKNTSCKPDDQDGTGATTLHLACRFNHTPIVEWLLDEAKVDSSVRTASGGLALHFAVVGGDTETVKLLLEDDPSSVNYQLGNGATSTYLSAQEGHLDILRQLVLEYRGNVKIKSYDGMSCVHAAAQSGNLPCLKFLVDEQKYNGNERDFDGATPLHFAASQGHASIIDWLMKEGGAKVTLDNLGGSPLHNAVESNQIECVRVLLLNGCSVDITDNNGLKAAELARKCSNNKCANLIENFKPQSQFPPDDDIAYLAAVQSPRQPPVLFSNQKLNTKPNAQIGFHGNKPTVNGGYRSEITQISKGGHPGQRSRPRSPEVDYSVNWSKIDNTTKSGTNTHVPPIILGDMTDGGSPDRRSPVLGNSLGSSSSSLSSLSQLDDAVAFAERVIANEIQREKHFKPHPPQFTSNGRTNSKGGNSAWNGVNNGGINTDIGHKDSKVVKFGLMDDDYDDAMSARPVSKRVDIIVASAKSLNGNLVNGGNETGWVRNGAKSVTAKRNSTDIILPSGSSAISSGKDKGFNNGSVNSYSNLPNPLVTQNLTQNARQTAYNHTPPPPSDRHSPVQVLVNGTEINNSPPTHNDTDNEDIYSYTKRITKEKVVGMDNGSTNKVNKIPAPPPLSTLPSNRHQQQAIDKKPQRPTNIPLKSDPVPSNLVGSNLSLFTDAYVADDNSQTGSDVKTGNDVKTGSNVISVGSPPAPPPPPPPPPPPGPAINGNQPKKNMDEIKKKTTSLPARPTRMFTPEMIQNQRTTLSPAQPRVVVEDNSKTDFIQELKLATKGPGLRKTSLTSPIGTKPAAIPMMSFSGGQKKNLSRQSSQEDKNSKVELTGEWDPKNFVDKVPNKADLPSWKVQLQARQIAEKTMKETLEQRKVEEREARFKNMPAWKRALMEKKEAEAKAAEEKRMADEQKAQQKTVQKRVPKVNITSAPAQQGNLAPWQLELQGK